MPPRTIAKLFDSRRPPRRQQNSKVETADSRFGGIDGLGTDSTVWKDFAIVLHAAWDGLQVYRGLIG